jgi:hypothetical protein
MLAALGTAAAAGRDRIRLGPQVSNREAVFYETLDLEEGNGP